MRSVNRAGQPQRLASWLARSRSWPLAAHGWGAMAHVLANPACCLLYGKILQPGVTRRAVVHLRTAGLSAGTHGCSLLLPPFAAGKVAHGCAARARAFSLTSLLDLALAQYERESGAALFQGRLACTSACTISLPI